MFPSKRRNRGKDRRVPTDSVPLVTPQSEIVQAIWDSNDPYSVWIQLSVPIDATPRYIPFAQITCDGSNATALGLHPSGNWIVTQYEFDTIKTGTALVIPSNLQLQNALGGPIAAGTYIVQEGTAPG